MSDGNQDLRTRIAAAIAQADGDIGPDSWDYKLADAVIRELGLRIEYGALDANNCGRSSDYDELTALPGETIKTRFITDWTTKNA